MDNQCGGGPFGPTGKFPRGKLNADDEGALQLGLTNHNGKVIIQFGVPIKWLGLGPQEAADLASGLIKHAREAARTTGVGIRVDV